jgi:hypothetical protein
VPGSPSLTIPLMRNDAIGHPGGESLPQTSLNMKHLVGGSRSGYGLFQAGKLNDAKDAFVDVLTQTCAIPLA